MDGCAWFIDYAATNYTSVDVVMLRHVESKMFGFTGVVFGNESARSTWNYWEKRNTHAKNLWVLL